MKTLELFDGTNDAVWDLVGSVCEDNGGTADGNSWLANPYYDDLTDKIMDQAVEAGVGKIVEVAESDDDEMLALLGLPPREDSHAEIDEDLVETMKEAANQQLEWAHYGAYGTMDGIWFFIKKEAGV